MSFSPILLFTYNRPEHTQAILDSLATNKEASESILYIFCDGLKENASEENRIKNEQVKKIIKKETRFKEIRLQIQEKNKGLACSIIDGLNFVFSSHETAIVLEDDLIVSPYFLNYMNTALSAYQNDKQVGEIGGCNFFACGPKYPKYFFTNMPDTWGWATWKDRWEKFNEDAVFLYKALEKNNKMFAFNTYGAYDMEGMLKEQIFGKVDSWAIRWQAVMVLNDWLCLYPNPSYTNHIESINATHAKANIIPPLEQNEPTFEKIEIKEIELTTKAMKLGYSGKGDYFGRYTRKYLKKRLKKIIKTVLLFFVPFGIVQIFKNNKHKK
ncbi:hypothetical protein [Flavobacterium sp.]|jgi:GT2 family glycosyltransferase|uniref:hypothetical protein n=1 Tax=Flavobacterium sp. TaxID=239 RepID=UPI0037C0B802